ncbi:MAG TPA: hypothetical protein VKS01_06595, partial [Bryobacteraceae bacterium]|nr:hypothetical protein [Bryobacteraceae bacterium]
ERNERFRCWTVLEQAESNTGIAFCDKGFGPAYPWGLVFLSRRMNTGMDCSWYASLEQAFRESLACQHAADFDYLRLRVNEKDSVVARAEPRFFASPKFFRSPSPDSAKR